MKILGIHGGTTVQQHDAGAALLINGQLICCVEEERLFRQKSATGLLPVLAIEACLREASLKIQDIDVLAMPGSTYEDIQDRTRDWVVHHFGHCPEIYAVNHQAAHLASAFYHSGFETGLCISYDAYGDRLSGAVGVGDVKKGIQVTETFSDQNSLGVFYATITSFLGFKPGEDEYKVMGLAPYGIPNVDLSFFCRPEKDSFFVDQKYFRTRKNATQYEPYYSSTLLRHLGEPRRRGQPLSDHHKNVAASAQAALEACVLNLVENQIKKTGYKNLCLAGGVAQNCSANGKIANLPALTEIFVAPGASDRGLALGAALFTASLRGETIYPIPHVFYGPSESCKSIEKSLEISGVAHEKVNDPAGKAADLLTQGKIVGWYQGRSEFGPRALGHRSILADPRSSNMKNEINRRIKFREEFRPFAPSVLLEHAAAMYDLKKDSPYMTVAYQTKPCGEKKTPATTHVNGSSRVQTVDKNIDPLFHSMISSFYNKTGCPAILNTSFNIMGQPIVERPLEAISTFFGCGMDYLIMDNYLLKK